MSHVDHAYVVLAQRREDRPRMAAVDGEDELDAELAQNASDQRPAVDQRRFGRAALVVERLAPIHVWRHRRAPSRRVIAGYGGKGKTPAGAGAAAVPTA